MSRSPAIREMCDDTHHHVEYKPQTTWSSCSSHETVKNASSKSKPLVDRFAVWLTSVRWRGVLAMLSGFFSQMLCWGLIMAYGTILSYYVRYLIPGVPITLVALAGAVPPFLLLQLALLWGRLLDAGHHRLLNMLACIFLTCGMTGLAFTAEDHYNSGKYWAILLTSIPVGVGQSIYFLAAPHTAKTWHPKRKGLAMGITNCGAAVGGITWPFTFIRLVEALGFRRGIGCLAGATAGLSIFIVIFGTPAPDFQRRSIGQAKNLRVWWPTGAFRSKVFIIHVLSMCFIYLGILTVPFFIEIWAGHSPAISISEDISKSTGIDSTLSPELSVYILVAMNGAQFPGRLFGSSLCDKFKARKIHAIACFVAVILIASCWFVVGSFTGAIVFMVLFGLTLGVMVSLPINDVQDILGNERTYLLGQYAGVVYTCACPFVLSGAVMSGYLVQRWDVYIAPGAWAIGCFFFGGCFIVLGLCMKDDTACFEERSEQEADENGGDTRVNSQLGADPEAGGQ